jgi:Pvc16 N-terminal domain
MIYESLKFLCEEVNKYLNTKKTPGSISQPWLVLSNISVAGDNSSGLTDPDIKDKLVVSVVNVEEDKVAKQQEHYTKSDLTTIYKNPPLYLNYYILFSMSRKRYDDNLIFLGYIIQFFQHQNVFSPITHPGLDSRIQRIVVDLHNMSFEQTNHLWSVLGGKYFPSVMYKVRQVTLNEDVTISESGFIKEIQLNDKMKTAVS